MHSEILRELTARYAKGLAVFERYLVLHDQSLQRVAAAADAIARLGKPTDARGKYLLIDARSRAEKLALDHNRICDALEVMGAQLATAKQADRKSTRLNSSHLDLSRMPSSA